ncbi:hypothetical protein [Rhizobium sp. MHM7A]|uniref:hypothetical protein n=1 Tax=Rhizobium sp. MHM7A TaxID=2583233 RepID=UPI001105C45C|nr:hypothetical protein [Rhizobium sp. MHM7A]TLX16521.1 hypothetical protein FFR93_04060 [Rhizobium sp. MHM7A]
MWRLFLYFLVLSAVLTVLRFIILLVAEPIQRRSLKKRLGEGTDKTLESLVADWRKKAGRSLWFNFVGIPSVAFMAIILIAQYA